MPYLKNIDRQYAEQFGPGGPGELNYLITRLCLRYMHERGGPSYALLNEIVGVLESAKLEFYRRAVAPYESAKAQANGDVYE